jgi:hypothetical protein
LKAIEPVAPQLFVVLVGLLVAIGGFAVYVLYLALWGTVALACMVARRILGLRSSRPPETD